MKKVKVLVAQLCRVFTAPWNVARQPPLCMEFPRQESWSGLPCPSPGESSQPRDGTWVSCLASPDFPGGSDGKESACNAGVPSLGREDPLEEEMATH